MSEGMKVNPKFCGITEPPPSLVLGLREAQLWARLPAKDADSHRMTRWHLWGVVRSGWLCSAYQNCWKENPLSPIPKEINEDWFNFYAWEMGLWPSQKTFPDCLLHPKSTLVQVPVTPMFAPLAICMSASPLDGKPCEAGLCLVHHCTPGTQHKAPSSTAYEAPNME